MTKLYYRGMAEKDGKPKIGRSARLLGVRPGTDIDVEHPQQEGLEQLDSYLARSGLDSGWLFIFDRRTKAPSLEERLSTQITTTKNKRSVIVIRA